MSMGPKEAALRATLAQAQDGKVEHAQAAWSDGAAVLQSVYQALHAAAPAIRNQFGDQTGKAASEAFTTLAEKVRFRSEQMTMASTAMLDARDAILHAQMIRDSMEDPIGPAPTKPQSTPGSSSEADVKAQQKYDSDKAQYDALYDARERKSEAASKQLDGKYTQSAEQLAKVHGEPDKPKTDETKDPQNTGGGGGGTGGGGTGGGGGGGGGTHNGVIVRNPTVHPVHHHPTENNTTTTTTTTTTTQTTPTTTTTETLPPGSTQSSSPTPSVPIGGSGGSTGGSTSTPSSGMPSGATAGGLAGALGGGALGGMTGISGAVRGGAVAMPTGSAGSAGGTLGSTARSAGASTLGRTTGGAGGAAGGKAGGSGARSAGGGAGGGKSGSRGKAGGRGMGAGGGQGGKGKKDPKQKGHEFFDEEHDWIDDEGAAPGVID
ncbi:hypothetical protein H5V45_10120 [Nocardioides sp. KIGAM211]|uniref:Uncharacterized protein n=1 Tax=Nocardioides luti TaxID=2761101 RepID=A0A7X0VAT3_9ACTN|nr:hypothetical protein [Nocardioides luti]MBB6627675.1 hypothetical protein [Nocardioides luti]